MSERQRRNEDRIESELEAHRVDAFAHQPMMNRVLQESLTLREKFENRLTATEVETANVRRSFESFKAQTVALGGIGLLVLGAVTSAVAFKLLGL